MTITLDLAPHLLSVLNCFLFLAAVLVGIKLWRK